MNITSEIPNWYAFFAHSSQGLAVVYNFPPIIPTPPYLTNCKNAFSSACKARVCTWLLLLSILLWGFVE